MKTRVVLAATAVAGALVSASACSNPTGKAWAITYEVTDQNGGTLSEVSYAQSPSSFNHETRKAKVDGPVGVPWKEKVVVSAGGKAEVTATPSGNMRLTCRILLDGEKELASATAPAAGQPVTCAKVTDS